MLTIIIRAGWNDYDRNDLDTVELLEDDNGEVRVFSDRKTADAWLEKNQNHEIGYSYNIVEI